MGIFDLFGKQELKKKEKKNSTDLMIGKPSAAFEQVMNTQDDNCDDGEVSNREVQDDCVHDKSNNENDYKRDNNDRTIVNSSDVPPDVHDDSIIEAISDQEIRNDSLQQPAKANKKVDSNNMEENKEELGINIGEEAKDDISSLKEKPELLMDNGNVEIIESPQGKEDNKSKTTELNGRYKLDDWEEEDEQIPYAVDSEGESYFHRYDLVGNIAKMDRLFVFGTSMRGEDHYAFKYPRQDSFVVKHQKGKNGKNYVIAIIADGVSSALLADQLAEYISNYTANLLGKSLMEGSLADIEWNELTTHIWKESLKFCKEISESDDIISFFEKWATTLEFIVVESLDPKTNKYVHVTVVGDGAAYLVNKKGQWHNIKSGKTRKNHMISNGVVALPSQPDNIIVREGRLDKGDFLLLVTDGISDIVENNNEVKNFFWEKMLWVRNLPEFVRIINAGIRQMGDDRTAILIKYYERGDKD